MSDNANTGLGYIPSIERPALYTDQSMKPLEWKSPYFAFDPALDTVREDVPANVGTGALRAWDPVKQKLKREIPMHGIWNPGTPTTAGNPVF